MVQGYDCPFSATSLNIMNRVGDDRPARLGDGKTFRNKSSSKFLGIQVDALGATMGAVLPREHAAMALWFMHRAHMCCPKIPLTDRNARLFSSAGAAFLCGVGVWALCTDVWSMCSKLEG